MPRTRRETLSVSSAFASAISSRTRSCTFSVTSWIASPRSDGLGSVIAARDRSEDLGEQERACEGGADQHLGLVLRRRGEAGLRPGGLRRRRGRSAGGGLRARRGGGAHTGRGHSGAGGGTGRVRRPASGLLGQAPGLVGLLALAPRLL